MPTYAATVSIGNKTHTKKVLITINLTKKNKNNKLQGASHMRGSMFSLKDYNMTICCKNWLERCQLPFHRGNCK